MKKIILILICFFSFAPSSFAQSALGLSAIPPRLEITVKPGEVVTQEIKIRNESQIQRFISTSAKDFIVTDDRGTPLQIETEDGNFENRWAASSWLSVSPSSLTIKPGETKSLILTVIVPDDVTPGGHYAMVLHTPQNETVISDTGSAIETNVGTLVYLTIPGDITENAQVTRFDAPKFSEYGPIDFSTIVTNLSDVHISPIGSITVKNIFGLKTADIPLEKLNIFPYTSREFQNTLAKKWLFGRYQARLAAGYGTTGGLLAATIYFWVIPWKLILTLLAIATILVLLFVIFKKKNPESQDQLADLEKELESLKKKYRDRK